MSILKPNLFQTMFTLLETRSQLYFFALLLIQDAKRKSWKIKKNWLILGKVCVSSNEENYFLYTQIMPIEEREPKLEGGWIVVKREKRR